MQYFIKISLLAGNNKLILLCLPIMCLISSCQKVTISTIAPDNITIEQPKQEEVEINSDGYEVILFCGNPGVGKSSLCNSIFNEHKFESGVIIGTGLTLEHQEHIYKNKSYIDTPGLSDLKRRKEAAKEIEAALKKDNKYKIIFVITLEAGRLRPDDFATINAICESITVPFEYGIIINKVSNEVDEEIKEKGGVEEVLKPYFDILLNRKVSSKNLLIIKKDQGMDDVKNARLTNSAERIKLANFISEIKANFIKSEEVQEINVIDYERKVQELEKKLNNLALGPVIPTNIGIGPRILLGIGGTAFRIVSRPINSFINICYNLRVWQNGDYTNGITINDYPTGQQEDSESKETATTNEKNDNLTGQQEDSTAKESATNDYPADQQVGNTPNGKSDSTLDEKDNNKAEVKKDDDNDPFYTFGQNSKVSIINLIENVKEQAEETFKAMEKDDWSEFS